MTSKKNRPTKKARYEPPEMIPVQRGIATHIVSADGTTTHTQYLSPRKEKASSTSTAVSDSGLLPSLINYASQMIGIGSRSKETEPGPVHDSEQVPPMDPANATDAKQDDSSATKAKFSNTIVRLLILLVSNR